MSRLQKTTRRRFLQVTATGVGGLLVGFPLDFLMGQSSPSSGEPWRIGFFVEIRPDDHIIVHVPKPEIGQGVHTAYAMLVAEELEADFQRVSVRQLPVRLVPREGQEGYRWLHGSQDVGGSTSVIHGWELMRQAGAEAKRRLVAAAARRWNVTADDCRAESGQVICKSDGSRLAYGALAREAAGLPDMEEPAPLKASEDFKLVGTWQRTRGVEDIVRGRVEYGIDAELPGMLRAVVARAPRLGAKLDSFDAEEALAVPGVRHVVPVTGPEPMGDFAFTPIADGLAVVADSHWAAVQGRRKLKVQWTEGAMTGVGTDTLDQRIEEQMAGEGQVIRNDGDVEKAFQAADRIFEAGYSLPLVSHATLEPQGCIAHVRQDGCDIIVPTQDTSDTVFAVRKATGLPVEKINVRVTRVGGGFGRRLDEDYVPEAVQVSQAVGKPVHVLWTREDDMRNDFYRPLARHKFRIGLKDGKISGWEHRLATTGRYFRRPGVKREEIYRPEYWLDDFPAGILSDLRVRYFFVETAIPTGPWRAPGHTVNVFAVQSLLDELAHELGEDPLAFRLRLLGEPRELDYEQHGGPVFDTGRLANVLRTAAEKSGWGQELPEGQGRGLAGHFTFGSYVAHVVQVRVSAEGELRILKVNSAVDCGVPVNLNGVKAQTEGSVNDGISVALGQKITLRDGAVVEGNFDQYKMMRIDQSPPEIEVEVVRSGKQLKGMGEPAIPPVAPALTNAVFAACGKRIRTLPIADQLI